MKSLQSKAALVTLYAPSTFCLSVYALPITSPQYHTLTSAFKVLLTRKSISRSWCLSARATTLLYTSHILFLLASPLAFFLKTSNTSSLSSQNKHNSSSSLFESSLVSTNPRTPTHWRRTTITSTYSILLPGVSLTIQSQHKITSRSASTSLSTSYPNHISREYYSTEFKRHIWVPQRRIWVNIKVFQLSPDFPAKLSLSLLSRSAHSYIHSSHVPLQLNFNHDGPIRTFLTNTQFTTYKPICLNCSWNASIYRLSLRSTWTTGLEEKD